MVYRRHIVARIGVAVSIAAFATLARAALDPLLHDQIPYLAYVAALVITTWFCGVAGGLVSTFIGALAGNYFFVDPRYEFIPHQPDWVAMTVFCATGTGLVWLVARWRRAETTLREQAEALSTANRMKDEFLATLSHELRTPLNAIVGWSDMLLRGKLSGEAVQRATESIYTNAQAQCQMINDILDVSRIISGRTRIDMQPVNPVALLNHALDSVRPTADAKSVAMVADFASQSMPVLGDSDRLQQVFWNILSNAVKFTPPGGEVRVRLTFPAASMRVEVTDTGLGIARDFLPYVFERFRQFDSSSTRRHGGLGLGLAIVRHLVELHGGTVTAESDGEGKGATFTVTLPTQPATERRHVPATTVPQVLAVSGAEGSLPSLAGTRVLIVDDEADALEMTAAVVVDHGANVATASGADHALSTIDAFAPTVLLIDIAMPDVDGYMLLKRIRERPGRSGQVPAIAVTAYARDEDRRRALSAGFDQHLPKPVEVHTLVRAIARLSSAASVRTHPSTI